MIVQSAPEGAEHFIITMDQHTALSARFAEHFGNEHFEPVEPRCADAARHRTSRCWLARVGRTGITRPGNRLTVQPGEDTVRAYSRDQQRIPGYQQ